MSKIASTAASNDAHSPNPQPKSGPPHSSFSDYFYPRRNQHSWFVFRLALGFFGAALVLLPLALPQSWIAAIFGLAFFMTSILLPPVLASHTQSEKPDTSRARSEMPREFHGQLVLHGAEYCSGLAGLVPVQLIVSETEILAMKSNLQPAIVVPTGELSSVFLQRSEKSWLLFLLWSGKETAFAFHGHLGERHARKAEAAIHNFIRVTPEKAKVRAAGA
jgi:hypothetical protein